MNCERARSFVIDLDRTQAERDELMAALAHVQDCVECRSAARDYDSIRDALRDTNEDVEPAEGWDSFEDRLAGSVVKKRPRLKLVPAAVAACIAGVVIGWMFSGHMGSDNSVRPHAQPDAARFVMAPPTEQEVVDRANLFNQVSDVFDGKAEWILLADHASDMGVGSSATGKGKTPLLIRLTISRDGALFSNADLIVVPGQAARTTVPAADNLELKYEVVTSPVDPGHVRITAELRKANQDSQRVGSIGSDVSIRMGQILSIGQVVTGTGTYEFNVGLYRTSTTGLRS
jgi:hypothetical protein